MRTPSVARFFPDSLASLARHVKEFFFFPASARPVAFVRIGVSLILMAQALMTRSAIWDFFASSGLLQGELAAPVRSPGVLNLMLIQSWLAPFGTSEGHCILSVCGLYFTSLVFLAFGLYSRPAAIVAWLLHWVLMNSADSTNYGIDIYAHVFLFYLIWAPASDALSLDGWLRGRRDRSSSAARLSLRVMQLQLCLSYLSSGLDKAAGEQWRNGEVLFRAMSLPLYKQFETGWIANWPALSWLACWSTLLLEIGYCVFIWPRVTRRIWILGIVGLHVGIVFFLGLTLFGTIMCTLTVCCFGISAESEDWSISNLAEANANRPTFALATE